LHRLGIVLFNKELTKQHYIIRYWKKGDNHPRDVSPLIYSFNIYPVCRFLINLRENA
jgi:hypothetical protein